MGINEENHLQPKPSIISSNNNLDSQVKIGPSKSKFSTVIVSDEQLSKVDSTPPPISKKTSRKPSKFDIVQVSEQDLRHKDASQSDTISVDKSTSTIISYNGIPITINKTNE